MDKTELEKIYLETTYSVFIGAKEVYCKISETAPSAVNNLLSKEESAAILTAWNPRSHSLPQQENEQRNNQLLLSLQRNNHTVLKARGQGNDKSWLAEESFFIVGLSKEEAEHLAVDYEQNAFVWFEVNKTVSLEFSRIWQ